MKNHLIVRFAVLMFSVLLVAGFVGYRGGAFDSLLGVREPAPDPDPTADPAPSQVPAMGGTKSKQVFDPKEIMSSSKSIAPLLPPHKEPEKPKITILPGSKSPGVVVPPIPSKPEAAPVQQQQATSPPK